MVPSLVSLYTRDSGSVQLNTVHTHTADSRGLSEHHIQSLLHYHHTYMVRALYCLSVYVHTVVAKSMLPCVKSILYIPQYVHQRIDQSTSEQPSLCEGEYCMVCVCACVCVCVCVCACVCVSQRWDKYMWPSKT